MHRLDRFDEAPEFDDELPSLPIPRPGEGRPEHAGVQPPPLAQPRLGGGASFTAAADRSAVNAAAPEGPEPEAPITDVSAQRRDTERFAWELAAQLTSGMLANPSRSHSSVKDAMALFDQFLQEMHAYSRIASDYERGEDERRRREHVEYFHREGDAQQSIAAAGPALPAPLPAKPRPEPTQPAPPAHYSPLPPNARTRYMPGSMAGAPPEPTGDADADAPAA